MAKATIVTIHTRLANLLPFSRHEPIYPKDGWLVSSQAKDVYMEELEENEHWYTFQLEYGILFNCYIQQHPAVGYVPVSFTGISPLPSLMFVYTTFLEIM